MANSEITAKPNTKAIAKVYYTMTAYLVSFALPVVLVFAISWIHPGSWGLSMILTSDYIRPTDRLPLFVSLLVHLFPLSWLDAGRISLRGCFNPILTVFLLLQYIGPGFIGLSIALFLVDPQRKTPIQSVRLIAWASLLTLACIALGFVQW